MLDLTDQNWSEQRTQTWTAAVLLHVCPHPVVLVLDGNKHSFIIPIGPIEAIKGLKSFLFLHIEDMAQSVNFVRSKAKTTKYPSSSTTIIMPVTPGALNRCLPVSFNIGFCDSRLVWLKELFGKFWTDWKAITHRLSKYVCPARSCNTSPILWKLLLYLCQKRDRLMSCRCCPTLLSTFRFFTL